MTLCEQVVETKKPWFEVMMLLCEFPQAHLHVVGMLRFMSGFNQPSLSTPFHSIFVSVSVLMALSTVLHSINFHDTSPPSHSVLPVLFLPDWSFQLFISS